MKVQVPLSAKIVLWLCLNLLFLVLVCYVFFRMQFRLGVDWLLAGQAEERIEAVSDLIATELSEKPRSQWNSTLERFSTAYQVKFILLRNDGSLLAGEPTPIPPPVRTKLASFRGPPPFPPRDNPLREGSPREGSSREGLAREGLAREGSPLPREGPPRQEGRGRRGLEQPGLDREMNLAPGPLPRPFPKMMVRTANPTRYWALVRIPVGEMERLRPMPAAVAIVSPTMRGGGLFFDLTPWLVVGSGLLLVSVVFWFPLMRGITGSISQMTHATEQIAQGRFDVRVDERRNDELGALGQAVNRMAARLAGFVTGQKRFLGDTAHELCTPLARIQMALGVLEQRADEKQRAYVEDVREEVQHMSSLVSELLSFSKASLGGTAVRLQPVNVRRIVEQAIDREASDEGEIRSELPDDLRVMADPDLLLRSLSNLIRNALRYAGPAGPISISAQRADHSVSITVSDCGPGIPEEALHQIFDPFYRLDSSRARETGGVGLGLAIVKTCVESCQGTVTCQNRQPSGLIVSIKLASAPANS